MKKCLLSIVLALPCQIVLAQDVWDLKRCIDFAIKNNIQVRQNKVQEEIADLNAKQSSASRIPNFNFQGSTGGQFGRSIDPATNLFTNNAITFVNTSFSSNVTLFNWFGLKNQVEANRLSAAATQAQTLVIQNDISLNVASAYLQALLSHEQMRITAVQVGQVKEQLAMTRKRVAAGSLPELNAAELSAQLARDSANFVAAESQFEINQLNLKALLNLDAAVPFKIAIPQADAIPVEPIASLQPDEVFQMAVSRQPRQQANQLRLEAAKKNSLSARAAMYPTISAFANIQSAYSSAFESLPQGKNIITIVPTQSFVTVNGTNYNVNTPIMRPEGFVEANLWRQLDYNRRQIVGLSLNVPIFNGMQAKTQYQRARLNEHTIELQMLADTLQLKQDIYQAYQGAVNALNNFHSRQRSVEAAQYSYDLGKKRYEVGLLPVIELITLQNNLQRAKIDEASSQYEYIFRLKILEFYKYNTIKL